MPLRHPSRDVEETVGYINLEERSGPRIQIWKYGPISRINHKLNKNTKKESINNFIF